jgi:hypothetical protein
MALTATCEACGHTWFIKGTIPSVCAKCKSTRWNESLRDPLKLLDRLNDIRTRCGLYAAQPTETPTPTTGTPASVTEYPVRTEVKPKAANPAFTRIPEKKKEDYPKKSKIQEIEEAKITTIIMGLSDMPNWNTATPEQKTEAIKAKAMEAGIYLKQDWTLDDWEPPVKPEDGPKQPLRTFQSASEIQRLD